MKLSALFTYPIKSCGSIAHNSLAIFASGAQYDRRWMLTDTSYHFLSQRDFPQLALIQPTITEHILHLTAPNMPPLDIPLRLKQDAPTVSVTIWRDTVPAIDEGDRVAEWFSTALGRTARLVYMPDSTYRALDPRYAKRPGNVSFADGYPLLVVTESSLEDLNRRLMERDKQPVPMSRFRPNIVIAGAEEAWAEDQWHEIEIGTMRFDLVKPCARCTMTTVDQATAQIIDVQEPLATLSLFRRNEKGGVLFGQNTIAHTHGTLTVGDHVSVLKHA